MTTRLNSKEQAYLPVNSNPDKFIKIQDLFYPKECILIWIGDEELRKDMNMIRRQIRTTMVDLGFRIMDRGELDENQLKKLNKDLYNLYELETLYKAVLISRNVK